LLHAHSNPRASSAKTPNSEVRPFSALGSIHGSALVAPAAAR